MNADEICKHVPCSIKNWLCVVVSELIVRTMADLTAFSNKSFNSAVWINAALKDIPEDESLEAYISSLSTKLHIMSQDYTDQLETAMVESMSTMPRILSEISKTEDQLRTIEAEMKSLSQQLNSFDQRNVAGVEDLSRLDTLKTNMEKCKATLEEHARWSQLVREAKIIMEGGGRLSDSADRYDCSCLFLPSNVCITFLYILSIVASRRCFDRWIY